VPSAVVWLLAAAILLGPPLAVVGLVVWARRLRMRGAPRFVVWVAYVLAALVGLVIGTGYVGEVIVATHRVVEGTVEPSDKARALAEGISGVMNAGALALLIAVVGGAGLGVWALRARYPPRMGNMAGAQRSPGDDRTALETEVANKRKEYLDALIKAPDRATMVAQINLAGLFPEDEVAGATADVARAMEKMHVTDRVRLFVEVKRCAYEEALQRLRSAEDAARQDRNEAIQNSVKKSYWWIVGLTFVIMLATLVQAYKLIRP
jgi:hypothetical protein